MRQISYGTCGLCGVRKTKAAMGAHVRKCLLGTSEVERTKILLLRAQACDDPLMWLIIAARPSAKLRTMDDLLRRVWLECCGHLSEFTHKQIGVVGMRRSIGDVLSLPKSKLGYEYDFGSYTRLVLSHVGVVEAAPLKSALVAARNEAPVWFCDVCGQPAVSVCAACSGGDEGFCCEAHAADHPCGEDSLLPVVNSPRMGVCGYTGEV